MTKSFYPVCLFCASLALSSCNQSPQAVTAEKPSAASPQTDVQPSPDTTIYETWAVKLTKASKKYTFKESEEFDRCSSVIMSDKSGKKVSLPKAVEAELSCIGSSFMFFEDRYIVFQDKNDVNIYDLDTKKTALLFKNYEGIQTNLTDISDDKSKLLFVNVFYDDDTRKKTDYTQKTRIMVVELDKTTLAVKNKKKYDRLVMWVNAEGDMILKEDCQFVNNNTIKYREHQADSDGIPARDAKMIELSL